MKQVTITTDGSCDPNPGVGGWAAVLRYGTAVREISGGAQHSTNNAMELTAMVAGLQVLRESCHVLIRSDSKCAVAWCRNSNRPRMLTNPKYAHIRDLITAYRKLAGRHRIEFEWLKGHAGDADNERADVLAADARRSPFGT